MSTKYPGGFITKSPVAPTSTAASGIWTLDQQQQAQKAGTWPSPPIFIEDLFSTWLYTGNGSTQTITNGIDLAGKGGLVWTKIRNGTGSNRLVDTVRGGGNVLISNATNANVYDATIVPTFSSSGFDTGGGIDISSFNYVSWTFREQPKFFDVVTYTGNGAPAGQVINHNLGSVPGFIICKCTSTTQDWAVCARTGGAASPASAITYATGLSLNTTAAAGYTGTFGNFPTATTFNTAGLFTSPGEYPNLSGQTYVAYLFAHNAGGFPASGTGSENGISCGSSVGGGSAGDVTVNLGYEPQWVLLKNITTTNAALGPWILIDNMRGYFAPTTGENYLRANASNAEATGGFWTSHLTATGFTHYANAGESYIYIAIRRGPMRTPTTGTSVFEPATRTGTGANTTVTTSVSPVDMAWAFNRNGTLGQSTVDFDRLRGALNVLYTGASSGEFSAPNTLTGFDVQNGYRLGSDADGYGINFSGAPFVNYNFKRAPGFFDEVCYTGTGVDAGITHNLGVVPEMIIYKERANADVWRVGANFTPTTWNATFLNQTNSGTDLTYGTTRQYTAKPTATQFFVSSFYNDPGQRNVVYLFASCPGVSKVGSFTGTGATQVINCGFTTGARFVLIKATSTTGNWLVWDSARGIVAGNDPYLALNSTAAEVTNTDWVDTAATGFELSNAGGNLANSNGVSYIFLAIA